ncbi:Hypothetical predicted protein [Octopus vulgaris]|uniref:Uncharacterized protein n=1 Tax=Octopus vulgaris TaxID=6645 RepID=A0AA36B2T2_OCTVU|nr:Hypothetical predicted protein [Octopus vulgaris]
MGLEILLLISIIKDSLLQVKPETVEKVPDLTEIPGAQHLQVIVEGRRLRCYFCGDSGHTSLLSEGKNERREYELQQPLTPLQPQQQTPQLGQAAAAETTTTPTETIGHNSIHKPTTAPAAAAART